MSDHTGSRRFVGLLVVGVLVGTALPLVAAVVPAQAATIVVTTTVDGVPGSLRAAFDAANASPGDDIIELASDTTYELTICGPSNDANATGDLEHRQVSELTILGHGSTLHQLCPNANAIGTEKPAGALRLDGLTISGAAGGAIEGAGTVELDRVALVDNGGAPQAQASVGGVSARDLVLVDSTIAGNVGAMFGGAAFGRSILVQSSTITGNAPSGISTLGSHDDPAATLAHATVVENTSDGETRDLDLFAVAGQGTLETESSVVGYCNGVVESVDTRSYGFNAETGRTCGFTHPTDQRDVPDFGIGGLADNGGSTPTLLPDADSPLVDAAWDCVELPGIELDQRGEPRPMGQGCDIGAAEAPGPLPIVVTVLTDGGPGSLRDAVDAANANAGADTIRLDAAHHTLDLCGPAEDANAAGDLDATDPAGLTLLGEGATLDSSCGGPAVHAVVGEVSVRALWMDGGGVLGSEVEALGSTIRKSDGHGIEASASAEVYYSHIEDNAGTGVLSPSACNSGAYALVDSSTVSGNAVGIQAPDVLAHWTTVTDNGPGPVGGGIIVAGDLLLYSSTVHGNRSSTEGAGIRAMPCVNFENDLQVLLSTVTANEAPTGGANLHGDDAALIAIGSVLAEAAGGGADCDITQTLGWASFDGDGSCGLDDPDSISGGGDPQLGPLADNTDGLFTGLVTLTRLPAPGSPLIDGFWSCKGTDLVVLPQQALDQRGIMRAQGSWCDMGAVEVEQTPTFVDVPYSYPTFFHEIECLADLGVTEGYPDGSFRPALAITRQAVAAWLWRLAGSPAPVDAPPFTDVAADHPFADAIAWLAEAGITAGWPDGTFRPGVEITRAAVSAWLWRAAAEPAPSGPSPFTDVDLSDTFGEAIVWLAEIEVAAGWSDATFRPTRSITRQGLAAWVCRYEHADVLVS